MPLDGSEDAEQALPYAAMIAKWLDAELTLFNTVHPGPPFLYYREGQVRYPDQLQDRAEFLSNSYLSEVAKGLTEAGVKARWGVASGDAARLIAARAAGGEFGLIVMAVTVRSPLRRTLRPTVLEQFWRYTATPALIVKVRRRRKSVQTPLAPPELVVPLGGDSVSEEAGPYAAALAGASGARVTLIAAQVRRRRGLLDLYSGKPPDGKESKAEVRIREVAARLMKDRLTVQAEARVGIPAHVVTSRNNESQGSWVVMSSTMSSGIPRLLHGSTADGVLRNGRGPVLVVPSSVVAAKRAEVAPFLMQTRLRRAGVE